MSPFRPPSVFAGVRKSSKSYAGCTGASSGAGILAICIRMARAFHSGHGPPGLRTPCCDGAWRLKPLSACRAQHTRQVSRADSLLSNWVVMTRGLTIVFAASGSFCPKAFLQCYVPRFRNHRFSAL